MVGPLTAQKLLLKFGTVKSVINANENELIDIEGLGKQKNKEDNRIFGLMDKKEAGIFPNIHIH